MQNKMNESKQALRDGWNELSLWWQDMKQATKELKEGRNKPHMYRSTDRNQKKRWTDNAK